MSWSRIRRQEETLREKVATVLLDHLSDPRIGFVTVTRVELSRDRRTAQVFFTVLGTDEQRRTTERALKSAAPAIQERIGRTLTIRFTPSLRFVYDETVEIESRVRGVIDGLSTDPEGPGDPGNAEEADHDSDPSEES